MSANDLDEESGVKQIYLLEDFFNFPIPNSKFSKINLLKILEAQEMCQCFSKCEINSIY
jgi:hypothetical protein